MTKELDKLMDKKARDYTEEDIVLIITDIRKQLARWDAGEKPKRSIEEDDKVQEILSKFIQAKAEAKPKMKRRM